MKKRINNTSIKRTVVGLFVTLLGASSFALNPNYGYSPEQTPTNVMNQAYYVDQFYAFSQFPFEYQPQGVLKVWVKGSSGKVSTKEFEKYLNFKWEGSAVKSKTFIKFVKGNERGQSLLITEYNDEAQTPDSFEVWLTSLRKVRRFAHPNANDSWMGSSLTNGDMWMTKPEMEAYEIVSEGAENVCPESVGSLLSAVGQVCDSSAKKDVLVVKSTPKETNKAYDYKMSYVDKANFSNYKTDYYKNGEKVKSVYKNWQSMGMQDPRASAWSQIYAIDYKTQAETVVQMAPSRNTVVPEFWSSIGLEKSKR